MKLVQHVGIAAAALLFAGCGPEEGIGPPDTGRDAGARDAGARDAGGQDAGLRDGGVLLEPCAPGAPVIEDWAPVEDAATIIVATLHIDEPELRFEGGTAYRTPGDCIFRAESGTYLVRLSSQGVERASMTIELANDTVTIVAGAGYTNRAPSLVAMDIDFTDPPPDRWHAQFVHLAPEALEEPLRVYTYPPGTPRPIPPTAEPMLVGTVAHAQVLRADVPAQTELLAFLPASSTVAIDAAALPLVPCAAARATMAHIVWCDSVIGGEPPCDATLGSAWFLHTIGGDGCF